MNERGEENFTPNYTGKFFDKTTGLYYFNARWYDCELGRFTTQDPARDGVNWWIYCGGNPITFVDPTGEILLSINTNYNMSDYPNDDLGNSSSIKISDEGCYITTFANIFASSKYYGIPLENANKYDSPEKINNNKSIFAEDSACLNGRKESMNALFGEGNWDYWTRAVQGADGLESKISEYSKSEKAYMIVGIFDLSDDTAVATNHMVGISELPDSNGYFTNGLTATSNGDYNRLINIRDKSAYNINNLKEIRVIFLED